MSDSTQLPDKNCWDIRTGQSARTKIVLGSPIFESKSCFHGRRPIAESQELQWRSISSCSFPYLREKASEKSKYISRSVVNTCRTSCNRAMTLSFSLRVTNWQIVHAAFPFFLVRHLYTRASRPQHLSSSIFAACARTDPPPPPQFCVWNTSVFFPPGGRCVFPLSWSWKLDINSCRKPSSRHLMVAQDGCVCTSTVLLVVRDGSNWREYRFEDFFLVTLKKQWRRDTNERQWRAVQVRLNKQHLHWSLKLSTIRRIVELKWSTHNRRRQMEFFERVARHRQCYWTRRNGFSEEKRLGRRRRWRTPGGRCWWRSANTICLTKLRDSWMP